MLLHSSNEYSIMAGRQGLPGHNAWQSGTGQQPMLVLNLPSPLHNTLTVLYFVFGLYPATIKENLEILILLHSPLESWDAEHISSDLAHSGLGTDPGWGSVHARYTLSQLSYFPSLASRV